RVLAAGGARCQIERLEMQGTGIEPAEAPERRRAPPREGKLDRIRSTRFVDRRRAIDVAGAGARGAVAGRAGGTGRLLTPAAPRRVSGRARSTGVAAAGASRARAETAGTAGAFAAPARDGTGSFAASPGAPGPRATVRTECRGPPGRSAGRAAIVTEIASFEAHDEPAGWQGHQRKR